MLRSKRDWRVAVVIVVALTCVASLLLASRTPSRWHVTVTRNWRIYTAEALEFEAGGLRVKTRITHYVGPVAISATREWTQREAHPDIGTGFFK